MGYDPLFPAKAVSCTLVLCSVVNKLVVDAGVILVFGRMDFWWGRGLLRLSIGQHHYYSPSLRMAAQVPLGDHFSITVCIVSGGLTHLQGWAQNLGLASQDIPFHRPQWCNWDGYMTQARPVRLRPRLLLEPLGRKCFLLSLLRYLDPGQFCHHQGRASLRIQLTQRKVETKKDRSLVSLCEPLNPAMTEVTLSIGLFNYASQ